MKVNDPNLSTAGSAGAARASETARANTANRAATSGAVNPSSNDDVHLSELVRSLRSLAADSPERQVQIEQLTRAYAAGNYKIDAEATASAIIQDAINGASINGDGSIGGGTIKA
jgi:flagellar biosynthesis anti-sigma factor FlgM